ncbi:MAG: hypothetical protein RR882_17125, partial [Comamonas sp.]
MPTPGPRRRQDRRSTHHDPRSTRAAAAQAPRPIPHCQRQPRAANLQTQMLRRTILPTMCAFPCLLSVAPLRL